MDDLVVSPSGNLSTREFLGQELIDYVEKRFYQRVTRIKVKVSWDSMDYIRKFIKIHITTNIYDEKQDVTARLPNRAITELLLQLLDQLNRKLGNPKKVVNITFSLPQAWAFSELYLCIDAESNDNYALAVIKPIISYFNQVLS